MSIVASITSSATSPAGTSSVLREGLLQNPSAGTSITTMKPRRENIRLLRERADALRRELDTAVDGTEAAEVAARLAEGREREAAAALHAAARTGEMQCAKLRELEDELRYKDGRIKVLEAIVATLETKRK